MTYNIRLDLESDGLNSWNNRKAFLLTQVRFHAPDILGVQEALPSQVMYMREQLAEYQKAGLGRDENNQGEASCIFFRSARFHVKDSGTFWLSESPGQVSRGWDAALNRVCTYVYLKDKRSGRSFWVFNSHFDHIGTLARKRSMELILAKISSMNIANHPVVFMGDLNSEPDAPHILLARQTMDDAKEVTLLPPLGPEGTFNAFNYQEAATRRIDYIFLSRKTMVKVLKYAVLSDARDLRFPSDHFPVIAELEF